MHTRRKSSVVNEQLSASPEKNQVETSANVSVQTDNLVVNDHDYCVHIEDSACDSDIEWS